MYDTLLPLSSGAQPNVVPNEVNMQPMQVLNDDTHQPISDAELHDALVAEREDIEESRTLPKWLVQTLRVSKLDAPLSSCTCSAALIVLLMYQLLWIGRF